MMGKLYGFWEMWELDKIGFLNQSLRWYRRAILLPLATFSIFFLSLKIWKARKKSGHKTGNNLNSLKKRQKCLSPMAESNSRRKSAQDLYPSALSTRPLLRICPSCFYALLNGIGLQS